MPAPAPESASLIGGLGPGSLTTFTSRVILPVSSNADARVLDRDIQSSKMVHAARGYESARSHSVVEPLRRSAMVL